jgi:hypothetical protein
MKTVIVRYVIFTVLRIRDVYPGSRILIFTHPGSRLPDLGSRISDPGSRIPDHGSRITDPGSRIPDPGSQISDPGSQNRNKTEGWKKICCHSFLCSHKFHKIENYLSFEMLKKKIWVNFQRKLLYFTKKSATKL